MDVDEEGLLYYIDHVRQRTQRDPPWPDTSTQPTHRERHNPRSPKPPVYRNLGDVDSPVSDNGYAPSPSGSPTLAGELPRSAMLDDDGYDDLPDGWEWQSAGSGAMFFFHKKSQRASWCDPRLAEEFGVDLTVLPETIDVDCDAKGLYVIDHLTRTTSRNIDALIELGADADDSMDSPLRRALAASRIPEDSPGSDLYEVMIHDTPSTLNQRKPLHTDAVSTPALLTEKSQKEESVFRSLIRSLSALGSLCCPTGQSSDNGSIELLSVKVISDFEGVPPTPRGEESSNDAEEEHREEHENRGVRRVRFDDDDIV